MSPSSGVRSAYDVPALEVGRWREANPHDADQSVTRDVLAQRLAEIEPLSRFDTVGPFEVARIVERQAQAQGFIPELYRAQLVIADVQVRRGQTTPGGSTTRELQTEIERMGDSYLLARVNRVMSSFYWRMGDYGTAMQCAIASVKLLDPDAPAAVRDEHCIAVADVHATRGLVAEAAEQYRMVAERSAARSDRILQLAAYNNLAYLLVSEGEVARASAVAAQLQAIVAEHRMPLPWSWLDTIAQIRLREGAYAATVELLEPRIERALRDGVFEVVGLTECSLCLATAYRALGDVVVAKQALDRCDDLMKRHQITFMRVAVLNERAAWHADQSQFAEAYRLQREAYELAARVDQRDRDDRARALLVMHQYDEATQDRNKFRQMSYTDSLTRLPNRRFVDDALDRCLSVAHRAGGTLAVALLDLDHFKRINDTWSHAVGDSVLQHVASILAQATGMPVASDSLKFDAGAVDVQRLLNDPTLPFAARFGGEEFVIVLPDHDGASAARVCNDVLEGMRGATWDQLPDGVSVTGSAGLVVASGAALAREVLAHADDLLYAAKHAGRDCLRGPDEVIHIKESGSS